MRTGNVTQCNWLCNTEVIDGVGLNTCGNTKTLSHSPPPYGRTSRVRDSLLVRQSGCAGGRGFAPRPGQ